MILAGIAAKYVGRPIGTLSVMVASLGSAACGSQQNSYAESPTASDGTGEPPCINGMREYEDRFELCNADEEGGLSEPSEPEAIGDMRVQVDLDGDSEVGIVQFIRQYHLANEPQLRNRASAIAVGRYHEKIFQYLDEVQPRHIFVEGMTEEFPPGSADLHSQYLLYHHPELVAVSIKKHEGIPLSTEDNYALLGILGAAHVYKVLHDEEVHLHPTIAREEALRINEAVHNLQDKDDLPVAELVEDPDFLQFTKLDPYATDKMVSFLRSNPGETIYVIFGAQHTFCDDFLDADFLPLMYSRWWHFPGYPAFESRPCSIPQEP